MYVPAGSAASRTTTLGPLFEASRDAPLVTVRSSELHFENESSACATPVPMVSEKLREGFFGLSEPENVTV